jgi:hypothetical protein
MPVTLTIFAAGFHDLTPIHELTYELPEEAVLYGDKAFNAAVDEASILEEVGVLVVPIRRKNMKVQNSLGEMFGLARCCRRIESDHARQVRFMVKNGKFAVGIDGDSAFTCSNTGWF